MISDTLSMTIQLIESYQNECPEIYKKYEQELDELEKQMFRVARNVVMAEEKLKAA